MTNIFKTKHFWITWVLQAVVGIFFARLILGPIFTLIAENGGVQETEKFVWVTLSVYLIFVWITQFVAVLLLQKPKPLALRLVLVGSYLELGLPSVVAVRFSSFGQSTITKWLMGIVAFFVAFMVVNIIGQVFIVLLLDPALTALVL